MMAPHTICVAFLQIWNYFKTKVQKMAQYKHVIKYAISYFMGKDLLFYIPNNASSQHIFSLL